MLYGQETFMLYGQETFMLYGQETFMLYGAVKKGEICSQTDKNTTETYMQRLLRILRRYKAPPEISGGAYILQLRYEV